MESFTKYLWPESCQNSTDSVETRPMLKFYFPEEDSDSPRPAVIVCPGGGYAHLADHEGEPYAKLANSCGCVAAVLTYRVAPHKFPAPQADAARAIRMVRSMADELNVNPNKIAIWGSSAGGHLACITATRPDLHTDKHDDLAENFSARPNGLILCYPVITMHDDFAHTGSGDNLLGEEIPMAERKELSPELHVTPKNPPTFIFFTADDQAVPVENGLYFAAALRKAKVDVELHVYPNGPHGVGLAMERPRLAKWPELLKDWLAEWKEK